MTDRQTVSDMIRAAFARRDQLRDELRAIEQEIAEARTLLEPRSIAAPVTERPPKVVQARSVVEADEMRELEQDRLDAILAERQPSPRVYNWNDIDGRRETIRATVAAKGPITASKLVALLEIPVRLTHTIENDLQALRRDGKVETRTGLVGFVAVGAVIPPAPAPEPAMRVKAAGPLAERRCGRCCGKFRPTASTQYVCSKPECAKPARVQPDERPEVETVRSGKDAAVSHYSGGSALNAAGRV